MEGEDAIYIIRGRESEVGATFVSMAKFGLKGVLGPLCRFLSHEGSRVRRMS